MPKAIFKVTETKLAAKGEDLQRIATRVPAELRQFLKIQSAVLGYSLNKIHATALREFLSLALPTSKGGQTIAWLTPKTSPRADRHGAPRGDANWVQLLLILPQSLVGELEAACELTGTSIATFCYTALDWYANEQQRRQKALATAQQAAFGQAAATSVAAAPAAQDRPAVVKLDPLMPLAASMALADLDPRMRQAPAGATVALNEQQAPQADEAVVAAKKSAKAAAKTSAASSRKRV